MKLIVGLGNAGPKYAGTRHNVGFDVVDVLASRANIAMTGEKFHGWFGLGMIGSERVALLKPTTFMNRSGRAVSAAGRFYKLELDELLIIADDIALPCGRLRVRPRGSAGGHNGLQDVADHAGSTEWSRLRVGIGECMGDQVSYVLGRFTEDQEALISAARPRAADAAWCWIVDGVDEAMNRFNGEWP